MNVTSTTAVRCLVATSSSESLPNYGEMLNQPKRFFQNVIMDNIYFREGCILAHESAEVAFINLYWKDGPSWKISAFCKHKSSFLHNQAVEVVYSLPRSGHDT